MTVLSKVLFFVAICFIFSCAANRPRPSANCQKFEEVLEILVSESPKHYQIHQIIVSDRRCTKSGLEFTLEIVGKHSDSDLLLHTRKRLLMFERDDGQPDLMELENLGEELSPDTGYY